MSISEPGTAARPSAPRNIYDQDDRGSWYVGLEKRRVRTALGDINVSLGGPASRPALVFWPSLMLNGSMWKFQVERFAPDYRIVLVDSPGHGESDALRRIIDLRDSARCVVDILDALAIERCILVGNSWGGMLATVFPAYFPERSIAAVGINCTGSLPTQEETIKFTLAANFLQLCAGIPGFMADMLSGLFPGATGAATKPEFRAYLRNVVAKDDPKSVGWALKSILLNRTDVHRLVGTIADVPVLVIAGEEDSQFPVWVVRRLANAIPTATFVEIARTGHLAALESPDEVNEAIASFLAAAKRT